MARCLECDCVYAVYGGSEGSKCPECGSTQIASTIMRNVKDPKDKEANNEQDSEV